MKKCILCGSNEQCDKGTDFEDEPYFECNINVRIVEYAIYVEARDSKGHHNYWHIDTPLVQGEDEKLTQNITMKLEKAIEGVLGG